ncbi:MAG: hypothetical protein GX589_00570, partial [Deltaproteobacteria bacterium]|nr:hypothetical protein [Deltaproteobacteria bacterium]
FPAQYDNLVRYYSRMVGLAGTTHKAFGKIWPAPPWGYWDMLVSRTTTLTLIAFFIGIVAIALTARKLIRSEVGRRQLSFLLLALVAVFFWPTVLSFTRKHAFRYLFPVMTMFLGVGAYGITWGLQHLCRVPEAHHVPARAFFLGLLVICALQGQVLLASAPDFLIYCNAPSGGLKGNISRGHRPMLAGFNETLGALQERTADWPVVETALMADRTTVMTAYRRLFPKNTERRYFEHFPNPENADFVFVVRSQISEKTLSALSNTARYKEVFNYVSHGVPLTSLYQVLPQSYREAERRFLNKARAHTGSAVRTDELLLPEDAEALGAQPVLYARPGRHKAGYLFFGEKPYFEAGRYRLTLSLTLPLNARSRFASESNPLLRVELVHGCVEEISSEGLVPGRLSDHLMECDVAYPQKREFRGFWYGVAPIVVSSLTIERVSD